MNKKIRSSIFKHVSYLFHFEKKLHNYSPEFNEKIRSCILLE